MIALGFALLLAATPQAQPPTDVSGVLVTPMPKKSPPVDATFNMTSDDDTLRSQGVSIWPADAYQVRRSGAVTLTCWINVEGLAEWCRVAFERPSGRGFADAAMAMRPHIKVAPRKGRDGQPVAGLMNVAMTYRAPNTEVIEPVGQKKLSRGNLEVRHNALPNTRITLMTNPVWAKTPSFETVDRAYPEAAGGATGFAVAHCRVGGDGRLSACRVATEEPRKQGFGEAAVKLAADFRVQPEIVHAPRGESVEVEVPIRFAPPGGAHTVSAPTWVQGPDPKATPKMFPPEAAAKGLTSGRGVARCVVDAGGGLATCAPDGADPEGFSEAAAKLASAMRMSLWSADARPVEGATVYVGVRLNLKGGS